MVSNIPIHWFSHFPFISYSVLAAANSSITGRGNLKQAP